MKTFGNIMMAICCMWLTACAVPLQAGLVEKFDKSMRDYNRMLRWQEVENAGMLYMEPEQRESFMSQAAELKKSGVTFTDYRILTTECLPDRKTATVIAEFEYYRLPSNRIKTRIYNQSWVYRDAGGVSGWRVKTPLPSFD